MQCPYSRLASLLPIIPTTHRKQRAAVLRKGDGFHLLLMLERRRERITGFHLPDTRLALPKLRPASNRDSLSIRAKSDGAYYRSVWNGGERDQVSMRGYIT